MQLACRADKLLLDAGPVRRFLEVGTTLLALKGYLGERALIVPQVRTELEVVQNWTGHAPLKLILNATPPWPAVVEAPEIAGLEDDIETVRLSLAKADEPQTKHVGEAATIVVARLLKIPLLGMDDGDARRIGRANGIPSVNSAVIAAEMVVRGQLGEPDGFQVYDVATPPQVGTAEWKQLMIDVDGDLQAAPAAW
jgi:predicted nucleic acid-binding protein